LYQVVTAFRAARRNPRRSAFANHRANTLARLRSLTDELERRPLHPVATEAIRHCLTLIERCGAAPADGSDTASSNPKQQVAAIAERLTQIVNDRRCA
jgi:hypothetical protein